VIGSILEYFEGDPSAFSLSSAESESEIKLHGAF
jgi:hypothetical protein